MDDDMLVLEDRRPLAVVGSLNPPLTMDAVVEVLLVVDVLILPNKSPPEGSLRPPAVPEERDNPPLAEAAPPPRTVVAADDVGLLPGFLAPHATHVREVSLLLTQQSSQVHETGPWLLEEGGPWLFEGGTEAGPVLEEVEPWLFEEEGTGLFKEEEPRLFEEEKPEKTEADLFEEAGLFPGLVAPQATQEDELSLLLTQQSSQVHDDEDKVVEGRASGCILLAEVVETDSYNKKV